MKRFFLQERNILIAIFVNAIIIFLRYFPELSENQWLILIDHVFIIFFMVEVIVKLRFLKPGPYFSNAWNMFDFIIIVGSLPTLLMDWIPFPDTSVLTVLRVLRLARLLRLIRFIPNFNQVIDGLGRALKASVFVLMAMMFLNFLLALFTCHFYSKTAPEYFGNPLVSSYTIFQLFTVEGWNEIPATIAQRTDNEWVIGFTRFYFVMIVLLGGVFGMSLANAVFVDEMTMDNNLALEDKIDKLQEQVEELKGLIQESKGT
ncbi:MAG: hypothetical protein DHS20C18_15510 [Saprospiraceae bacterium]|nr:MAG: hypothetical protein DHS20C18_15510 [Saprospiraceae bacterium]